MYFGQTDATAHVEAFPALDGEPGGSLPDADTTEQDLFGEILDRARRQRRTYVMEHECKEVLEDAGISTTGYGVARCLEEAVETADAIGYPVVLKIVSPEVVHKSDSGGVRLNVQDAEQVRAAYRDMVHAFAHQRVEGISVQHMAEQGLEAIIGVTSDPNFGPVLMFGLGGVFVEVLKDVTFRILPISEEDAKGMIEEIEGYRLLKGYRGHSVDIPALTHLLLRVSRLVTDHPEITELDLNPVFLYPSGNVIVDARMFIADARPMPAGAGSNTRDTLRGLFYPRSIAVVGASGSRGKLGYNVFRNLLSHGFQGDLYPVNPGKDLIQGVECRRSVSEIPDDVDLAVIIVPAGCAPDAVEQCCRKGIKYLVVETAGFAELGDDGRRAQEHIREIIREHGTRLLGPNCSGIINTHHNMVQSIGHVGELGKGNVGLIAQAGVYAAGILTGLRQVLDFGIVATIGNKMDISETDILEFMGEDDHIDVVAMYMEDVTSGRRFIDAACKVSAQKPVIALKAGKTEAGKKAVSSHTASLAGNDEINGAALRQGGIIRARDNEHLFGLTRAFAKQPVPAGDGVMVITYTGSLGVAATDMLYLSGLRLGTLEPTLQDRLGAILPDYVNTVNPVDFSFSMDADQLRETIEIGVESRDMSSFLVILQGELLESFVEVLDGICFKGKPVMCCVACKEFMMDGVIAMEKAGIPVYSTAEMAAETLSVMYGYGRRQKAVVSGR